MSDLKKKYYDGFQIHKILNEELDSGKTIMRILSRFADEPSAQPEIIRCKDCKNYEQEERPLTEDDYAYCGECDHVEMCRWYPMYGCEFKSRPSAQPDLEDIKNQALNCSAELLKLVALIGRHNKEDEP